jgi:hypothetical protein
MKGMLASECGKLIEKTEEDTYKALQHFFNEQILNSDRLNWAHHYYPDKPNPPMVGIILAKVHKEMEENDEEEKEENININYDENKDKDNRDPMPMEEDKEKNNSSSSLSLLSSLSLPTFNKRNCTREVWYGHTTPSMCIGYGYETISQGNEDDKDRIVGRREGQNYKVKTIISRLSSTTTTSASTSTSISSNNNKNNDKIKKKKMNWFNSSSRKEEKFKINGEVF